MAELPTELADLSEDEKVIERGLATFVEVGRALLRIRDGKKYRAAGYATFEEYCRGRWDWSRMHGHRMMVAAEVVGMLPPRLHSEPTEFQLRPLAPLRGEPEKATEAWGRAVEAAKGKAPTAAQVAEAVREVAPERFALVVPPPEAGVARSRELTEADFQDQFIRAINRLPHPAKFPPERVAAVPGLYEEVRPSLDALREYLDQIERLATAGRKTGRMRSVK